MKPQSLPQPRSGTGFGLGLVRPGSRSGAPELALPTDGTPVTLRLRGAARLSVAGGRAWITRAGWPDDHWLTPGQTLELPRPTGWLAQWFGWRVSVSGEGVSGATPVTLKAEALR